MISSILAGETELYYGLIRPYELSVYRAALSLMKTKSDAEDVAQEAFLKALVVLMNSVGRLSSALG